VQPVERLCRGASVSFLRDLRVQRRRRLRGFRAPGVEARPASARGEV